MNNWNPWAANWPQLATYYLDPINGSDSNAGTSQATAWLTHAKAEATALSAGQSIQKRIDGSWLTFKNCATVPRAGVILGYYQQLASPPMPVSALDFTALTHVVHDHVEPNADGSLNITFLNMTAANSATLISAARTAGVKALLAFSDIGTAHFTAAVTSALNTLVANIVSLVTTRGYDGVDIVWKTTATNPLLTSFVSALSSALKAANPNLLVCLTTGYTDASGAVIDSVFAQAAPYADLVNAACYDFFPTSTLLTWFNAPLYDAQLANSAGLAMASAYRHIALLIASGVAASKILLGLPFYGRVYAGSPTGLASTAPVAPRAPYTAVGSMTNTIVNYSALPSSYVAAKEHWDGVAQEPYLSLSNATASLNQFLTFDDPTAITSKTEWALLQLLAGVSIWELGLDYYSGRTIVSPLLNTVKCSWPKVALAAGATPSVPTGLAAQSTSTTSISLSWALVTAATSYTLKRSTTSGSGYTTIATVTGASYVDTSVSSGVTYYYVVASTTNGTSSANSAQIIATASAGSPPSAPTSLAGGTVTMTSTVNVEQVVLTWTGSASLYNVKRSAGVSGGPYTTIGTATSGTFTDSTLAPSTTYYYVVTAVVSGVESANSSQATVVAPAYTAANLLTSPSDLRNAAWSGVTSVTGATTIVGNASGVTALKQAAIPVSPSTNYVASATVLAAASGTPTDIPALINGDQTGTNEVVTSSVNTPIVQGYDWYTGPVIDQGNACGANRAVQPWGVLYVQASPATTSTQTWVNIKNFQCWWLRASTNVWTLGVSGNSFDGGVYSEDFVNDYTDESSGHSGDPYDSPGKQITTRTESDGTTSFQTTAGYLAHFWTANRFLMTLSNNTDLAGIVIACEARLLGSDNANSHFALSVGADYYKTLTSPGIENNPSVSNGKIKAPTVGWKAFLSTSMTLAQLRAAPSLAGKLALPDIINTGGGVSANVSLSVYQPGYITTPIAQSQMVTAGTPASFSVAVTTAAGETAAIFELDFDAAFAGSSITVTNPVFSASGGGGGTPPPVNLLASPSAINVSPWHASGTGASATGPSTLACASSGATSLAQTVPVTPNTNYTATVSMQASAASGVVSLSIYDVSFNTIGYTNLTLSTAQLTWTINFNSGTQTSLQFEIDLPAAAAGNTITVTGASFTAA